MALVLGFCLDAVVRVPGHGLRLWERLGTATARLEFVVRTGLPGRGALAGVVLLAWVAGGAALVAWALESLGFVLFQQEGRFAMRAALVALLISVRRPAAALLHTQAGLLAGDVALARQWLETTGPGTESEDAERVAGAAVSRVAEMLLRHAALPVFWTALFGAAGGAAAVAVSAVASFARARRDPDDPIWHPAFQVAEAAALPAGWLAMLAAQAVAALGGGNRARLASGWVTRPSLSPEARLAGAIAHGLQLGKSAGGPEEGRDVLPQDVQRGVVLLWTAGFVLAAGMSGACALLYWRF
jgi:cobalamin biosynthesis protein CobD/CbiB